MRFTFFTVTDLSLLGIRGSDICHAETKTVLIPESVSLR